MEQSLPRSNKTWTAEEKEYLMSRWGSVSITAIARTLGRSPNAVKIKAQRFGLGGVLMSGDYITLNQLVIAVTGSNYSYTYKMESWGKRGLPIHTKRVEKNSFKVVYLNEFWDWAEKNRSFVNFSKMEPLALGEEPDWVAEQRRKDFRAFALQRKDVWTPDEDSRLKMLLGQRRYGWAEISEMMHRSVGAIQHRIKGLDIKDRPIRANLHAKENAWTPDQFDILADGIRHADDYASIGRKIGKSEKAIRGKVYFTYLTENPDNVRHMLGDGKWGDGAPIPTVKQAVCLSWAKTAAKRDLSLLNALLRYRMNQLGYDSYWQRFLCMNWDDIRGCAAGCKDCDACTEFRRIRPQYCARCGGTFYERKENRFCGTCRTARKKRAQRHWCRENAGR